MSDPRNWITDGGRQPLTKGQHHVSLLVELAQSLVRGGRRIRRSSCGAGFESTSGPTRLTYDFIMGSDVLELDPPMRFNIALLGAVTLGWSVTLYAAMSAAILLGREGRSIWILVTASVVLWYVVDNALSIATGFPRNLITNTLFIAGYLIPVIQSGVLRR
jgi:hypothetical protein